ncbi:MAG: hypothetical protein HRT64_07905 [Erythrobacter sp.]|nr:hypothetical protein [Erythrobacter sp.]
MPSESELETEMKAKMPFIDRIWRAASSVELGAASSAPEVFDRLDPLFNVQGTNVRLEGETLTYSKTNPGAQDKLATFTSGTLTVVREPGGTRLAYDVGSTALFLCFLAPLAFLAFGQFASYLNEIEKPAIMAEIAEKEKEKEEEPEETIELHWIDQFLGATAPERPGEGDKESREQVSDRNGKSSEEDEEDEVQGYHSPNIAYAFAGLFFVVYLVGRVLEPYLLKRTFRAALDGADEPQIFEWDQNKEAGENPAPTTGGRTKS